MQFDTSIPGYPMAVIQPGQDVSLPYGEAVTDDELKPYVNKVATSVSVSPVPEPQIEQNILPRLAMRVGDAINMDYIRHDSMSSALRVYFQRLNRPLPTFPKALP